MMGRYSDHRGSRRRGFDDDGSVTSDAEPSYFLRTRASTSQTVDAEVVWFNATKGFGFVKATDGSEAFLHIRALEAAGSAGVSEGARLKVRIEKGQKGQQVAEVLEIAAGTAPSAGAGRSADAPSRGRAPDAREEEGQGSVKWYNSEKGFGFIGLDDEKKDVFVHATALTRSGLTTLAEGQNVVVLYVHGQKGLEARTVRPV